MGSFLNTIIRLFQLLVSPVSVFFTSVGGIVSIVLGAVNDPEGAVNTFLCRMIDLIASVLPSTPPELTIGSLLSSVGSSIPIIGWGIVLDVFTTAFTMLGIVLIIKLYKLIPFKAT